MGIAITLVAITTYDNWPRIRLTPKRAIFAVLRARPVRLMGWWDRSKVYRQKLELLPEEVGWMSSS
jgi:hypothetical protein